MSVRSRSTRTTFRYVGVRLAAALAGMAVFSSCHDSPTGLRPSAPTAVSKAVNALGNPYAIEYFIQAHQDDWQLFYGDKAADAANTATKVVFVYTTAGAADASDAYWQVREQGANAAHTSARFGPQSHDPKPPIEWPVSQMRLSSTS